MTDWATTKTRHGTSSGWRLHKELGEMPCDACATAKREYDRRRRAASPRTLQNRLLARAQQRAFMDLQRRYPEEYRALYRAHKEQLLAADASLGAASTTLNPPPGEHTGDQNA